MNDFRYKLSQLRYRMMERFQRFMVGRYGQPDELYRFLTVLNLVLIALSFVFRNYVFSLLVWIPIIYNSYRLFSKNIQARYDENTRFVNLKNNSRNLFKLTIRRFRERKDYRFRTCPACKKVLRLPNKKGRHNVICPNCHKQFEVKI
jgi:ssDNA-binding Zn-finger/Zn-ribbon topoisomerase 1